MSSCTKLIPLGLSCSFSLRPFFSRKHALHRLCTLSLAGLSSLFCYSLSLHTGKFFFDGGMSFRRLLKKVQEGEKGMSGLSAVFVG